MYNLSALEFCTRVINNKQRRISKPLNPDNLCKYLFDLYSLN